MAWTKEQETAIYKTGTNIIVSAGAGSGKTAVLTTRVLEKLKNGIHIDELLILTFTNAAAAEMKERIKKNIKKEGLIEELALLESAYITTFDSFALSIVKKYHYLLNIPKEINITDATILAMQKNKILDDIFSEYYESENPKFQKLITDFCTKDDENIKSELKKLINKLEIRTDKYDYLKNYINDYYQEKVYEEIITNYIEILKRKLEDLQLEIDTQSSYFETNYLNKIQDNLSSLFQESDLDSLIAKISIAKIPATPRGSEEETKLAREKVNNCLKELKTLCTYGGKEQIILDYQNTLDNLEMIIEIVTKFFHQFEDWKLENNAYDFTDIANFSLRIVKENPDILKELQTSLKEIMVDEYQDTSDTQEEFISLIAQNNVYMVGDIKQSIYRFRNANPYIFKNKYDAYQKEMNGYKIDLLKNFRSRMEVLDNINVIFNPIMTNTIGNAEYLESHQMNFGNTTYIEEGKTNQDYQMEILSYPTNKEFSKEEIEIFATGKDILDKVNNGYLIFDKDKKELHPATYQDFCIIMDRNTTFELVKKIFEYLKIPLILYKDEELNNSTDLELLKNLVTFLILLKERQFNTEFAFTFTSIARSYLYRLTDEEIFDIVTTRNYKDSIVYQDIYPITKEMNHLSTQEILELLFLKTKFYEKIITKGNILESTVRMEKMTQLTNSLSSLNYNIYDVKSYLTNILKDGISLKMSLNNPSGNAVKIMNIHKSKGLEFPICYFLGLYKSFSKEDLKGQIIYDKNYPIYIPDYYEGEKETIIKLLIKDRQMKEDISEKIRLFYVALTRAKEKMIMFLPEKEDLTEIKNVDGVILESIRYKYNSIASMLYSIPNTLKPYTKKLDLNTINLTKDYMIQKDMKQDLETVSKKLKVKPISIDVIEENHTSFPKKIQEILTKEEQKNIELGNLFHQTLEWVDLTNFQKEEISNSFIADKIDDMLNLELFQNIHKAKIYQEYEFIYQQDNQEYHGIIDLMLEYDDHIDIIDYKLSDITDYNYVKQLNGYKNYIKTKTNKTIHLYLFSILQTSIKEL